MIRGPALKELFTSGGRSSDCRWPIVVAAVGVWSSTRIRFCVLMRPHIAVSTRVHWHILDVVECLVRLAAAHGKQEHAACDVITHRSALCRP